MITPVIMPQLSLSMRVGIVNEWLKEEGDFVQKGEPLCVVEGDKAAIQIESPASGYLKRIVAKKGEEFPVKQALAYIGDREDTIEDTVVQEKIRPYEEAAVGLAVTERPSEYGKGESRRIKASPVAKRLAAELGIDLSTIQGTGPDGLISREDVLAAKALADKIAAPEGAGLRIEVEVSLTGIKKLVAERTKESYLDAPHIHLTLSCVMSEAVRLREKLNEKLAGQKHVTFTDMVIWATAQAIKQNKLFNSTIKEGKIITYADINIGFAVATDKGLIVPVIKNADKLSLLDIADARQALTQRLQEGKQTADDLSGGTFTVTNLGMFEVEMFDPIIAPGQASILGVGKVKMSAVVGEDGKITAEPTMALTLACDHRIADGVDGAKFLSGVKNLLEKPSRMFEGLLAT